MSLQAEQYRSQFCSQFHLERAMRNIYSHSMTSFAYVVRESFCFVVCHKNAPFNINVPSYVPESEALKLLKN